MAKEIKEFKSFDDFTNLYQVQKTLRFELKPVPKTRELLNLDKDSSLIFPSDKIRAENYVIIKKYIDELHTRFINKALENSEISFLDFYDEFAKKLSLKRKKKNKLTVSAEPGEGDTGGENLDKIEESLKKLRENKRNKRGNVIQLFNKLSKNAEEGMKGWVTISGTSSNDEDLAEDERGGVKVKGLLFEKGLIDILRLQFKNKLDSDESIPASFFNKEKEGKRKLSEVLNAFRAERDERGKKKKRGEPDFTTYFTDAFHKNRKNYYLADGKASRVATRIIDENLERFCKNVTTYREILQKVSLVEDLNKDWEIYFAEKTSFLNKEENKDIKSEIEKFRNEGDKWENLFMDVNIYNCYFLQTKIDTYNYIIGKLNGDIKEFNDKQEDNTPKVSFFETLFKQVHGKKRKQKDEFEIEDETLFKQTIGKNRETKESFINEFISHAEKKLKFSEMLFNRLRRQDFPDLSTVHISKRAIETLSSKFFIGVEKGESYQFLSDLILEEENKDLSNSRKRKTIKDFTDLKVVQTALGLTNKQDISEVFRSRYISNGKEKVELKDAVEVKKPILQRGKNWENLLAIIFYEFSILVERMKKSRELLFKQTDYQNKGDEEQEKQVVLLKDFSDSARGVFEMTKYFALRKNGVAYALDKDKDKIHDMVDWYLEGNDFVNEKDSEIQKVKEAFEEECLIKQYYDALRNFVTKKPWIENKIVLYFENPSFLNGWDTRKDQNADKGVILRKRIGVNETNGKEEFLYYLTIIKSEKKSTKKFKSFFNEINLYDKENLCEWQKLEYASITDPKKDIPHAVISPFLKKIKDKEGETTITIIDKQKNGAKKLKDLKIEPTDDFLNKYIKGCHLQGKNFDKDYLNNAYIPYITDCFTKYPNWKYFHIIFPEFKDCENTDSLYNFIKGNTYLPTFTGVSKEKIETRFFSEKQVGSNNGEHIYLFQIYNKDFGLDSEIGRELHGEKFKSKAEWRKERFKKGEEGYEKGIENEQTKLFTLLFDKEQNLKNKDGIVYKLSGGAKVFYRPGSEGLKKEVITTRAGEKREVYKGYRYKDGKLLFHVPIVCNFVNKGKQHGIGVHSDTGRMYGFQKRVNEFVAKKPYRIIAFDRGEKNLMYYCVLDEGTKILGGEMGSLNKIQRFDHNNKPISDINQEFCVDKKTGKIIDGEKIYDSSGKDYQKLLYRRQAERLVARQTWQRIENIKDLKKGYLSIVKNKICNLVLNSIKEGRVPIIVFEKLNEGMKQSRIKIEPQVYRHIEEELAVKLNYLVDKKRGDFLKAWQLTPLVKTFGGDIEQKRQVGIILYVNPDYTSTTCPKCGFRKRKYLKVDNARDDFTTGKIKIEFKDGRYLFSFGTPKEKNEDELVLEQVSSNVRRLIWNNGKTELISDMTQKVADLFNESKSKYGIKIKNSGDINKQFKKITNTDFWYRLTKYFNQILDIRNTQRIWYKKEEGEDGSVKIVEEGKEEDFIMCPNPDCLFYGNDKDETADTFQGYKWNGDANGAYNIGRKGIIAIERVKKYQLETEQFIQRWRIEKMRKGEKSGDKKYKPLEVNKDQYNEEYFVLKENEDDKFEDIPTDRRLRKYPDYLSIKTTKERYGDWDAYTAKWAKENGIR